MIDVKTGVHSISNEEYHKSPGFSRSAIMEFKKSPKHFWYKYINPNYIPPLPTPDLRFGEALHVALLEPNEFSNRYVIEEKIERRSNVGKAAYALMLERNRGKIILTPDEMNQIHKMTDVIFEDDQTRELITGAQYEKSIYWNDPETGILCKVRPDIWHHDFIVDFKTTKSASEYSFRSSMYEYGYYMQFAMMREAFEHALNIDMRNFLFLAQEKTEPYLAAIYQLDLVALDYGIREFKNILKELKVCLEKNSFPGYLPKVISLPTYAAPIEE